MADEYKFPTALETLSADYWFPKFIMGGLLLYPAYDSFSMEHPSSIFVSILLFLLSFTLLWLTRIKPEGEELKYRRVFQWKSQYSEIIDCKRSWVCGRIKTKQYNFPFWRNLFRASSRQKIWLPMGRGNHFFYPE